MAKRGRPKIQINWEEFDKLCSIHCTQLELAAWFKCTVDTIENTVKREKGMIFSEYYAQKSSPGKISLRRKQWELALKGDKTMIIWLGKQHLGQADKAESKNEHSGDASLTMVLKDYTTKQIPDGN
jgi:hypothetical protein